jgi:hypothetical protein
VALHQNDVPAPTVYTNQLGILFPALQVFRNSTYIHRGIFGGSVRPNICGTFYYKPGAARKFDPGCAVSIFETRKVRLLQSDAPPSYINGETSEKKLTSTVPAKKRE